MQREMSVAQEAFELLKRDILTMKLLPGQVLLTQHLSEELGISRTPVREALVRLMEIDFVEKINGGKFRVKEITWKMVVDLYKMRSLLESAAILEIAKTIDKEQIGRLEGLNDRMQTALEKDDFFDFFESDMAFHNYILTLYGNQVIINLLYRIEDYQQRIRYMTMCMESRMHDTINEHWRLVSYLKAHDGESAVSVLQEHLTKTVEDMETLRQNNFSSWSTLVKW